MNKVLSFLTILILAACSGQSSSVTSETSRETQESGRPVQTSSSTQSPHTTLTRTSSPEPDVEDYRKESDATMTPTGEKSQPAGQLLRELAGDRGFLIGAAVSPGPLRNDSSYSEVLSREFNLVTPENSLKFGPVHPEPGLYAFDDVDAILEFAQEHGMVVHGHVLVWHQQQPEWVNNGEWTAETLEAVLKEHILTVVGRYRGQIEYWDVVNEAFDDSGEFRDTVWSRYLGPDYIDQAFHWAHEADPQAKLFYNDYNTEGMNPKSDLVYDLVKDMLDRNVPVHGVGLQMHIPSGSVPRGLQDNIQRLADLGLEVQITELDVRIPGEITQEKLARQAKTYRQILEACLAVNQCTALITWGFTDRYSWVPGFFNGFGSALIFDSQYQAKPAYQALQDVFLGK